MQRVIIYKTIPQKNCKSSWPTTSIVINRRTRLYSKKKRKKLAKISLEHENGLSSSFTAGFFFTKLRPREVGNVINSSKTGSQRLILCVVVVRNRKREKNCDREDEIRMIFFSLLILVIFRLHFRLSSFFP